MNLPKGKGWASLAYWRSDAWKTVKEKLRDETQYNPSATQLFAALRAVHPDACRVAVLGQDPYPTSDHCTGVAFATPAAVDPLPPTLKNIFREYQSDLGYPAPKNGDLTKWCNQGVLLWNVYPSCVTGHPGSHHWPEWTDLTKEIVEKLDARGTVVFALLGSCARSYNRYITRSPYIETTHPSPLSASRGFLGSRLFSRINSELIQPIDWRLDGKDRITIQDGKP